MISTTAYEKGDRDGWADLKNKRTDQDHTWLVMGWRGQRNQET